MCYTPIVFLENLIAAALALTCAAFTALAY